MKDDEIRRLKEEINTLTERSDAAKEAEGICTFGDHEEWCASVVA